MCLHTLEGLLTGLSMAKVTTRHICAEFINDNLPWYTIYVLLDLFSHSSHIAVTLSPQHSDTRQYSGAIIKIDNFTTKYQTKVLSVSLCLLNTLYECYYKPNLSCEVLGGWLVFVCHWGAPLWPTDLEGVLWLCVVYSDVVFRRLQPAQAGDREARWTSLGRGLAGSFYSNPFKCIHVFWSVFSPSIHIQMFCVRKFVAILRSPNCQFCQIFATTRVLRQYLHFLALASLLGVCYKPVLYQTEWYQNNPDL